MVRYIFTENGSIAEINWIDILNLEEISFPCIRIIKIKMPMLMTMAYELNAIPIKTSIFFKIIEKNL